MFYGDPVFQGLLLDEADECVERPIVQSLVRVPTPVSILSDVFWMADSYCANVAFDALLADIAQEFVINVRGTPRRFCK